MSRVLQSALYRHDEQWLQRCPALMGLDEAGRGPLAGPVVAAAVMLQREAWSDAALQLCVQGCDDSKKLKQAQREAIFEQICQLQERGILAVTCHTGSVAEIEEHNILGATQLAMNRCVDSLWEQSGWSAEDCYEGKGDQLPLREAKVALLVDGLAMKQLRAPHQALIKGDGRSAVIALASVVAKVTRDRIMMALHEVLPQYGFDQHKGYGTRRHYTAIEKHGLCPAHRLSFLKKYSSRLPRG